MARAIESEDAQDRRSKRSLVLLAARLKVGDRHIDVRLRNLSRKGALLEADEPLTAGTNVVFERGETRVKARVAWASEVRFGIEFLKPIEESEVLVHIGRLRSAPDYKPVRRTGFRKVVLNEGERKMAESWVRPGDRALD